MLYALGALIAWWHGHAFDWRRYAIGQGAVTAFQLMTHYANDYFDYEADRANTTPTKWSGGSRVLPAGELPRRVALIAALVLAAIGCATVAFIDGGRYTIPTYALVLVLAWEYSAPPLRLCATGLGELDTAIVVTGLVPWLGFYLQAPDLVGLRTLLVAIPPLALLQIAMLLAIEFPDRAGDAATNKRTLVVRLGVQPAATLYVVITLAAYTWLPIGYALGLPARAAALAAVPAPVAIWRIAQADTNDPSAYERVAFFSVFLLVSTAAAMAIGFMN